MKNIYRFKAYCQISGETCRIEITVSGVNEYEAYNKANDKFKKFDKNHGTIYQEFIGVIDE